MSLDDVWTFKIEISPLIVCVQCAPCGPKLHSIPVWIGKTKEPGRPTVTMLCKYWQQMQNAAVAQKLFTILLKVQLTAIVQWLQLLFRHCSYTAIIEHFFNIYSIQLFSNNCSIQQLFKTVVQQLQNITIVQKLLYTTSLHRLVQQLQHTIIVWRLQHTSIIHQLHLTTLSAYKIIGIQLSFNNCFIQLLFKTADYNFYSLIAAYS